MTTFHHFTARALHEERATRLRAEVAAHRLAREAGRPASKRTGLAAPPANVRLLHPTRWRRTDDPGEPVSPVETATDWLTDRRAS